MRWHWLGSERCHQKLNFFSESDVDTKIGDGAPVAYSRPLPDPIWNSSRILWNGKATFLEDHSAPLSLSTLMQTRAYSKEKSAKQARSLHFHYWNNNNTITLNAVLHIMIILSDSGAYNCLIATFIGQACACHGASLLYCCCSCPDPCGRGRFDVVIPVSILNSMDGRTEPIAPWT